jgi:hypothetical protein
MNVMDKELENFLSLKENTKALENMVELANRNIVHMDKLIDSMGAFVEGKSDLGALQLMKWIRNQCEYNYYLGMITGNKFILFKRNLELYVCLSTCRPNERTEPFTPADRIIGLDNIISTKKGEGKRFVEKLIRHSDKSKNPICVWTESDSNTNYFLQFGFTSHGKIGNNGENLMIRKCN